MQMKAMIVGVIMVIVALIVWELAVKKLVVKNAFENYFEETENPYAEYLEKQV